MLCKVLDENNKKLTEKDWYGSYKCDGLRCLVFLRDGEVHTASRGGGNYDIPATYIRQDEYIIKILTENPDMILDGELYCHGKNLQTLSGWARKEELIDEHKFLRYHCYDIVNESMPFKDRVVKLNEFKANTPDDSKLTVLEQRLIHGLEEIEAMHNEAVAAGYEGLVIKDPEKEYKCGARDTRCLKVKKFQDAEAKILGIVEGLREEDMCFLMEMDNGIQFKAKPIGDRALKKWYREHIDEIVGQLGTYKYFYLSEDGVPILPTFRAIRNKKDI